MREQKQEDLAKAIENFQRRIEKNLRKKAELTKEAAECARNIRDLGVLPEDAFTRFEKTDIKKVSLYHHTC
jgi:structural maintenance of chromosome 3 (chondroitin sulfate proteoglycan 6)